MTASRANGESYRPSRFHPINFDDEFNNGRYRVIRKLGYGSFSTVWLAVDNNGFGLVGLKIMDAKYSSSAQTELDIYAAIAAKAVGDPLSNHVLLLRDTLDHTGPNGVHRCMIFEAMGPDATSAMAKKTLKDALSGLAFLHKHGIVHGDVQPGNMLFAISDVTSVGEDRLRQSENTISTPLRRLDGKEDRWAPKYLALGQSLHEYVDLERTVTVKLSDLGAAFWETNPPQSTVTPVALRAPEIIFEERPYTSGTDIWAFGCLVYELMTGAQLFSVWTIGPHDQEDDDIHILDLIDVLGPMPDRLMAKWPRKDKWIGPDGERLRPTKEKIESEDDGEDYSDESGANEGSTDAEDPVNRDKDESEEGSKTSGSPSEAQGPIISESLEEQFEKNKPVDIDSEEAKVVTTLIRRILNYDPTERPTAARLLQHPWFNH